MIVTARSQKCKEIAQFHLKIAPSPPAPYSDSIKLTENPLSLWHPIKVAKSRQCGAMQLGQRLRTPHATRSGLRLKLELELQCDYCAARARVCVVTCNAWLDWTDLGLLCSLPCLARLVMDFQLRADRVCCASRCAPNAPKVQVQVQVQVQLGLPCGVSCCVFAPLAALHHLATGRVAACSGPQFVNN